MTLASIDIRDFRCIEHAQLEFDPRLTLITGENASGKTSVLEAIFFLSCGRSFRTPLLETLIRRGAPSFMAVGRVDAQGTAPIILGVRGTRGGSEIRLGGEPASGFAEMASLLPVQVIDPEVHRLLEDGPSHRRRFVDWGVFHVEHAYIAAWRRYQRALKQRNAALRARRPADEVHLWDAEIVEMGEGVNASRQRYIEMLRPRAAEFGRNLLGLDVTITLASGWPPDQPLAVALTESWARDLQRGLTAVGPHRAELIVRVEGLLAKDRISRGQQKLLAAALLLAQIQLRADGGASQTSLLLDDPAAELDVDNLRKLLSLVARIPAQLIVTALDPQRLELPIPGRSFHVEQGKIAPVLYSRLS